MFLATLPNLVFEALYQLLDGRGGLNQMQRQLSDMELSSDPDNMPPRSRLFLVVPKQADAQQLHVSAIQRPQVARVQHCHSSLKKQGHSLTREKSIKNDSQLGLPSVCVPHTKVPLVLSVSC